MFDFVPTLSDGVISLTEIKEGDFESLYACASDKLIWASHPSKDRYQRPVFEKWFATARDSCGALKVIENASGRVIGSSRYYHLDTDKSEVSIGFTFLIREHWGGETNRKLKTLMFDHAFKTVDKVWLDIDAINIRSQKAAQKVGASYSHTQDKCMAGNTQNYRVYGLDKAVWQAKTSR